MSSSAPLPPWSEFTQDPRTPHAAMLRASDQDREVVIGVLTEAYADGRLDREEHEERTDVTRGTKTLGALAGLILDLVPQTPTPAQRRALARAEAEQRQQQAARRWERQRRQALLSFLVPTLVCWVVWLLTSIGPGSTWDAQWPWPAFVMLGTGLGLLRVVTQKQAIIAAERERLERRHRRALESRQRREPGPG